MTTAGPTVAPVTGPRGLGRIDPLSLAVAALVGLEAIALAMLWPQVAGTNDYVQLLSGGRALIAGLDLYDPASWSTRPIAVEQQPLSPIFTYPPWTALLFVPFALLPLHVGSLVWAVGGLALAALMTARVARRWSWPVLPCGVLATASWPALLVFLQGQWGYVLYALAAGCLLAIASRRDAWAGVAWGGALLAKPHLFVLGSVVLTVWAILSRRPRILLGALLTTILGAVLGTLAQPRWLEPFAGQLMGPVTRRSTQQPTLAGLAGDVAGGWWIVAWVIGVLVLAGIVVLLVRGTPTDQRLPVAFAATLALSVSSALYSWSYDQYLVLLLGAATLGIAAGRPVIRPVVFVAVATVFGPLAFALFESAYVRWHDTGAGLVPLFAILAAWGAVSSRRRGAA